MAQDIMSDLLIGTDSVDSLQAIRYRLRKAFPAVGICFPLIGLTAEEHGGWRQALDAYVDRLPNARLARLSREVADLFLMGWTREQLEVVVTSSLGLDASLWTETGTTWQFVVTIEERLSGLRLQRLGTNSRR